MEVPEQQSCLCLSKLKIAYIWQWYLMFWSRKASPTPHRRREEVIAQFIAHLKFPPYPTDSDYYSLAIKFTILNLTKFNLFSFGFVCRDKGHFSFQLSGHWYYILGYHYFQINHPEILINYPVTCADPEEGGSGVPGPSLKNHKNIRFLSNTGPDPLKNHTAKATKPAFNVGST